MDVNSQLRGLLIPRPVLLFEQTFRQSAEKDLQRFVSLYDKLAQSRWCFFSDYCLNDPAKKQSVIVFSLIPYLLRIDQLQNRVNKMVPCDYKDVCRPSKEMADFLAESPIFSVAIVLPNDITLSGDPLKEHALMVNILESYTRMLANWMLLENSKTDEQQQYQRLKTELNRLLKGFKDRDGDAWRSSTGKHIVAMRNAWIIANLYATLALGLLRISPNALFSWFPDRDSINSWPGNKRNDSILEIASHIIYVRSLREGLHYNPVKFCAVVPEKEGTLWYDVANRIPDHIAGVISQLDLETGDINDRLKIMRNKLIADNPWLVIISFSSYDAAQRKVLSKL